MKFKHPLSTVALLSSLLGVISFDAHGISSEPQASSSNTQGSQALLDEDLLDAENPLGEALENGNPILNIGTSSSVSQQGFPPLPIGPTAKKATASSGSIAPRKAVQDQKGPARAALARPDKNASAPRFSQRDASQEKPSHSYRTETPPFVNAATSRNESTSRGRTSAPQQSPAAAAQMSAEEKQARTLLSANGSPLTAQNITAVRQLISIANLRGANPAPYVISTVVLATRRMNVTEINIAATYQLITNPNYFQKPTVPQIQQMARVLQDGLKAPGFMAAKILLHANMLLTLPVIERTRIGLALLDTGIINPMDGLQFPLTLGNAKAVAIAASRHIIVNGPALDAILQMSAQNTKTPTGHQIADVGVSLDRLRVAGIDDGTGHNFNHANLDNVKAVTRVAALQDAVTQANLRDPTLALVAPAVNARHIKAAKHIGVEAPVFGAINGLAGQGRPNITLFQRLDNLNRDAAAKGAALVDAHPDHSHLSDLWTLRGGASNNTTALTTLVANAAPAAKAAVKDNYYNTLINAAKSLPEPNGLNRAQLFAAHRIRFQAIEELEAHFELIAALAELNGEARAHELREHADAVHIYVTTIKSTPRTH